MAFELTVDLIFFVIILSFGIIGAKKGFIKSIGGFIAMAISWLISRTAALPLTVIFFNHLNIDEKISSVISTMGNGMVENANQMLPDIGNNSIFALSSKFSAQVGNIVNQSALKFGTMLMTILLFSICMFILMFIIRHLEEAFKNIPLGNTTNILFGFMCGMVKGLILTVILYFIAYCLNTFLHCNIPLNDTFAGNIINTISHIHL